VRLFNPFAQRGVRMLGFVTDFERLNRRMHNKSFTADNQATIIGGRNIGDEYFDETDEAAFADLDVLAVGAIVDQVSTDFDRYWSSESAYPVDRLLKPAAEEAMDGLMARVGEAEQGSEFQDYSEAVKKNALLRELFEGSVRLEWAMTRIVSDDPGKVLKRSTDKVSLPAKMQELIGKPRHLLEMVSPYFVPMQQGLDYLLSLHSDGVRIRVLTNSLASTDVVAVHSGYARWRKPLLQGGIALYEYKPGAPTPRSGAGARGWERRAGDGMGRQGWRTPNAVSRDVSAGAGGPDGEDGSPAMRGSVSVAPTPSAGTAAGDGRSGSGDLPGSPRQVGLSVSNVSSVSSVSRGSRGSGGSSSSSLHAKTFSVDRSRVVIGSFNFDPRSFDLNTELSVVIDSPALASSVEEAYSRNVPLTAWQVTRTEPGELQWTEEKDGVQVRHDREPGAGFWRRVGAKAFGLLQIDWLL
jgi:putative cardiolipin synthase